MQRALTVSIAALAYVWFLADIAWGVAFLADVPVLTAVDHGRRGSTATAVAIDLTLLLAFALHHSVMARDRAKRAIARLLPASAERTAYVLVADALLALVLWQWRPIDGLLWNVQAQPWRSALWVGYGIGWAMAVAATFMVDHWDFVGLRQAITRPDDYRPPAFTVRWLYAWVRHPLLLGLLIASWATPTMSVGHLLFAAAATGYIAVGGYLEDRDLRRNLGEPYRQYARRTAAIVPVPRRSKSRAG